MNVFLTRWVCSTNYKDIALMYFVCAIWPAMLYTTLSIVIGLDYSACGLFFMVFFCPNLVVFGLENCSKPIGVSIKRGFLLVIQNLFNPSNFILLKQAVGTLIIMGSYVATLTLVHNFISITISTWMDCYYHFDGNFMTLHGRARFYELTLAGLFLGVTSTVMLALAPFRLALAPFQFVWRFFSGPTVECPTDLTLWNTETPTSVAHAYVLVHEPQGNEPQGNEPQGNEPRATSRWLLDFFGPCILPYLKLKLDSVLLPTAFYHRLSAPIFPLIVKPVLVIGQDLNRDDLFSNKYCFHDMERVMSVLLTERLNVVDRVSAVVCSCLDIPEIPAEDIKYPALFTSFIMRLFWPEIKVIINSVVENTIINNGPTEFILNWVDAYAPWNSIASLGSCLSALSAVYFLYVIYVLLTNIKKTVNAYLTTNKKVVHGETESTLEGLLPSPPAFHSFHQLPVIRSSGIVKKNSH